MTPLDLSTIQRQFGDATWERGVAYAREGRVLSCVEAEGMRGWYTARVSGSRAAPYAVEFQVGRTVVHGQCSCPVRYDCKHLVAALLTLADDDLSSDVQERRALTEWLDRVAQPPPPVEPRILPRAPRLDPPVADDREVRFVLRVLEARGDGRRSVELELQPRVGPSEGASNRRGKPRVVRLVATSAQTVIPAGVIKVDLELWHRFRSFAPADNERLTTREGATSLLLRFVETGRVRWQDWDGPVVHWVEEPRAAEARWLTTADALQQLEFDLDSKDDRVLPLDRPLWLNPQTGACGAIQTELPLDRRQRVFDAPPLRIEGALEPELLQRFDALALPQPVQGEVQRVEAEVIPILGFDRDTRDTRARVGFDYAGFTTSAGHTAAALSGWRDGVLTVVQRSAPAEAAALGVLRSVGLPTPRPDGTLPLDTDGWLQLLDVLPVLEASGWRIDGTASVPLAPLEPTAWYLDVDEGDDEQGWFSFELGVDIAGPDGARRVNLLPVLLQAIEEGRLQHDRIVVGAAVTLRLDDGTLLRIDADKVQRILDGLVAMTAGPARKRDRLRVTLYDAAWLSELAVDRWQGGPSLRELGEALRQGVKPDDADIPPDFRGVLRDYQKTGLAWMQLLRRTGCGGVLADDMGLGKTVQVLAHILSERTAGRLDRPALVVAPVSVLGTWAQQAAAFTPGLRVGLAHGPERAATLDTLPELDVVLTSYATLLRDPRLREAEYHLVALDEAQAIKNPRAKISIATRTLRTRQRLALTGTPIENNLTELWSIFRFVTPGLLGSQAQFGRVYARPVERDGDAAARGGLQRRVAPFLLRRTKDAVLTELPPKTEVVRTVVLSDSERELYETVRRSVSDDVREALRRKGLALSRIVVLEALLRLRQICCDARLAPMGSSISRTTSAKLDELEALLEPLLAAGHRVLLFSQFTKMLGLISDRLDARGQPYLLLTGQTRNRQNLVDRFQAREVPLMLVSLKAGGTGLNLTAADTVILYDPWWNPAVEQQAIDRTHRIGQERPVTVYRLVCEGSVEERILALQDRKRQLANAVQGGAAVRGRTGFTLDEADVDALLAPLGGSSIVS